MIILGCYKEIYNNNSYPSIKKDVNMLIEYKDRIVRYMKNGKISSCSPAIVKDVLSGEPINAPLSCMNDGIYAWRSDLIYYIEKYNINLPDDFIKHVLQNS